MRLLRAAVEVALNRDAPMRPRAMCRELGSAQRLSAHPASRPGQRTRAVRSWCGEANTVWRSITTGRAARIPNAAVPVRNGRGVRMDGDYAQSLGDNDIAAADVATAQSIYSQLGSARPIPRRRAAGPGGLTRREIEILIRIASGATNRQVAERVFISERTVGVIWRTSTPSSVSRRALRPCHGRTPTSVAALAVPLM